MTKPAETDKPKEPEQEVVEAVVADNAATDSESKAPTEGAAAEAEKKSHGARNVVLILLFIVLAVIAALVMSGKLKPLYASMQARLHHHVAESDERGQRQADDARAVEKDAAPMASQAASDQRRQAPLQQQASPAGGQRAGAEPGASQQNDSQQEPEPAGIEATGSQQLEQAQAAGIPSEEVQSLLSAIAGLRTQLQQMGATQQALQRGLKEQQQMNLQVRLRWIVDPASRLPQLQLAWEEISLLPGLSSSQRSEAVRMHKLARSRVQQLKQWQDALNRWADALVTPVQRNILPEPDYPWLAWIVRQFKLRPAPSVEARRLNDLRARLLDAARHLTLESWPKKGEWQSLQAELLLQIRAMHHGEGKNSQAIEIGLPESFDAIQADIATLRHTALQWQHGGVQ